MVVLCMALALGAVMGPLAGLLPALVPGAFTADPALWPLMRSVAVQVLGLWLRAGIHPVHPDVIITTIAIISILLLLFPRSLLVCSSGHCWRTGGRPVTGWRC